MLTQRGLSEIITDFFHLLGCGKRYGIYFPQKYSEMLKKGVCHS